MNDPNYWMNHALMLAREAEKHDEVPIGAVVVLDNELIGEGFNQSISNNDPTAHAEILALRQASLHIGNYRLVNAQLFSTLEPCCMCAGAMVHARIKTLFFATTDPRAGACGSVFELHHHPQLNHRIEVVQGFYQAEAAALLQSFFKKRRKTSLNNQR